MFSHFSLIRFRYKQLYRDVAKFAVFTLYIRAIQSAEYFHSYSRDKEDLTYHEEQILKIIQGVW